MADSESRTNASQVQRPRRAGHLNYKELNSIGRGNGAARASDPKPSKKQRTMGVSKTKTDALKEASKKRPTSTMDETDEPGERGDAVERAAKRVNSRSVQ